MEFAILEDNTEAVSVFFREVNLVKATGVIEYSINLELGGILLTSWLMPSLGYPGLFRAVLRLWKSVTSLTFVGSPSFDCFFIKDLCWTTLLAVPKAPKYLP